MNPNTKEFIIYGLPSLLELAALAKYIFVNQIYRSRVIYS